MEHHHSPHHPVHPALKPSVLIPLAIVVGGIIIAIAVYASLARQSGPTPVQGDPQLVRDVDASDHVFGNPVARVTIVEYSDFDCSYCKTFNETMRQIVANEGATGDVAWVLRHFPLIEIHPNALAHARAAECIAQVAGNDTFWKFEDILFRNQPVHPSQYGIFAKEVGVTDNAFAKCYADAADPSSTIEAKILADRQNALDMGAQGTPFSVIIVSGKPPVVMNGNYPYEEVKKLVDQALGK